LYKLLELKLLRSYREGNGMKYMVAMGMLISFSGLCASEPMIRALQPASGVQQKADVASVRKTAPDVVETGSEERNNKVADLRKKDGSAVSLTRKEKIKLASTEVVKIFAHGGVIPVCATGIAICINSMITGQDIPVEIAKGVFVLGATVISPALQYTFSAVQIGDKSRAVSGLLATALFHYFDVKAGQ
jgi:hypothetical protein